MDDQYRLLKLLSLVVWADDDGEHTGLRFVSEADDVAWRAPAAEALRQGTPAGADDEFRTRVHMVCAYYTSAVREYRKLRAGRDLADLPDFVLEAFAGMPHHLLPFFGEMVITTLVIPRADPAAVVRLWLNDLTETAWRLIVDTTRERFDVPAGWP
jgi:hypothetical protein